MGWKIWSLKPSRDFHTCPDWTWDQPILLYEYWVSFPGGKWPGRGVERPFSSSAKVKKRVKLHLYTSSGSSQAVIWKNVFL